MKRWNYFLGISLLSGFILWAGGFLAFQQKIGSYRQDESAVTDAIVVLTGGRNRIAEALRLYNQGLAQTLIISGVGHKVTLPEIEKENHTPVSRLPQHVILGDEATNTIENAIEVREVIRRKNITSVRLVTSFYHLPRSELEILAQNPDLKIVYHPVFSQNVSLKWWKRPGSFYLVASEYSKFLFVYVKNLFLRLREGD